ncbi:hypothetical protein [Bacteriovorax sp. BSW11_IV]|uniref:hypothetical protein n=1 Tax=Bacteriovorax sp. BSW11_IV TaxID=1353529 RepID=UPI0012DEB09E|nr:hypothetical protein [Bacteriovorax sp. BSW11_IV]
MALFESPRGIHPRLHSKNVDKILGYKIPKIEQKLLKNFRSYEQRADRSNKKDHFKGTQTWIGLHPQILQTPYSDILEIFKILEKQHVKTIVDFGAAYGRVGLVLSCLSNKYNFIGYEILDERANEAHRVFDKYNLKKAKILTCNILDNDFPVPQADVYFIYDFSEVDDIRHIIYRIEQTYPENDYYIVARGERVNQALRYKYSVFHDFKKNDSKIYFRKA